MAIEISDWNDLDNIRTDLSATYKLVNDLDEDTTGYDSLASDTANGGDGWEPIGDYTTGFTGSFDGQGHTISDLYIYRYTIDTVGLFGYSDTGGEVTNIGLRKLDVSGGDDIGGLIGINDGTVVNSYATGNVSGGNDAGGLIGDNYGTIKNSYATGSVSGNGDIGGLAAVNGGTIKNSYATGNVSGGNDAGGLVGDNGGTIKNSYANSETSGQSSLVSTNIGTITGGGMRTTAEMTDYYDYPNTYNNDHWDFDDVWKSTDWNEDQNGNAGYPALRSLTDRPSWYILTGCIREIKDAIDTVTEYKNTFVGEVDYSKTQYPAVQIIPGRTTERGNLEYSQEDDLIFLYRKGPKGKKTSELLDIIEEIEDATKVIEDEALTSQKIGPYKISEAEPYGPVDIKGTRLFPYMITLEYEMHKPD